MIPEFDFAESPLVPGLSVIEASAGTGKTYAISHLVPRLLLDGTAGSLGEILLVTFTNDATRELSDRVRRVLERLAASPAPDEAGAEPGVHRLRQKFPAARITAVIGRALLDLDRLGVSTIHSFCQRRLQTEGPLCGLPVVPELIPDADNLIEDALYDRWEKRIASDPLASAVATTMRWNPADDLRFVRAAWASPDAVAIPPPENFESGLRELDATAAQFTAAVCDELAACLGSVGRWTKDGLSADRDALIAALRQSRRASDTGYLEAIRQIAAADGWVHGAGKGAAAKQGVAGSAAVRLAGEALALLDRLRWDFQNDILADLRATVTSTLRANRQITYDGLIDALDAALRGPQARALADRLRSRYRVALIDESQDTDPRQFEIFRRVFVGFDREAPLTLHRLVLIGDPKQAIYAFRGADVNTYLAARAQAGERVFELTRTYRAPQPLVEAVNALFGREGSLLKEDLAFPAGSSGLPGDVQLVLDGRPCTARLEAWCVPDAESDAYSTLPKRTARIAELVATEITRILNGSPALVSTPPAGQTTSQPLHPGDIAVLVNSHREAAAVNHALLARAVPAVRAGTDDVMASEEAAELLTLLRAVHEPRRGELRRAALATRLLGRDQAALQNLRNDADLEEETLQRFLDWQEIWHRHGIAAALARVDREERVTARLAALERGERRVTNVRQLMDLLQTAAPEAGRRPGHLVRWLAQEILRASLRSTVEARQQQLESDADAVQIVTMHAAKGLEYSLVFCPFLWTGRNPDGVQKLSRPGRPTRLIDLDRSPEDPALSAEIRRIALEDRLRLAYVALTRARVKAWVLGGAVTGPRAAPPSALDWLLRADHATFDEAWKELASQPGRGARHVAGWESRQAAAPDPNVMAWTPGPVPSPAKWRAARESLPAPLAALPAPVLPAPWGMTSFSALTREKNAHGDGGPPAPPAPTPPGPTDAGNPFLSAPGGALIGTAVHDWIERWDFSAPTLEAVTAHLGRVALPPTVDGRSLPRALCGMLEELRTVRLPGLGATVEEACPHAQSSEWHFQLPIGGALSSQNLAGVFARHGHADYAALLAALPVEQLAGYLHGFLDRLAFHDGAWGVLDWKTNNLGPRAGDYAPAALASCARHSHYLLQAHLYLVALRRYLGPGVPIAGAWLVFLRGIRGGTSDGVLTIQPGEDLMAELDAFFAPPTLTASFRA